MPPATTTTSPVAVRRIARRPTAVPNGPRTRRRRRSRLGTGRRVTGPTSRTVCWSGPSLLPGAAHRDGRLADAEGGEHVELPRQECQRARPRRGRAKSVVTSPVSARRSTTRWGTGVIGRRTRRRRDRRMAADLVHLGRLHVSGHRRSRTGRAAGSGSPAGARGGRRRPVMTAGSRGRRRRRPWPAGRPRRRRWPPPGSMARASKCQR